MRDLIAAWLVQPTWTVFLWPAGFYLATGAIIHWLCFCPRWRSTALGFSGIVPPFFVSPALIFGLLLSFLAADVWERERLASRGVLEERDAVHALYQLSSVPGPVMQSLRPAVHDYLVAVLHDEWPLMHQQQESARAAAALDHLAQLAMDPAVTQQAGAAVHATLLAVVTHLTTVRSSRLSLSAGRFDDYKWSVVLLLGVVAQVGTAVVHLERRRPQLLALLIFSASAVIAVGLIALSEQPFQGARRVSLHPLVQLLDAASAPR